MQVGRFDPVARFRRFVCRELVSPQHCTEGYIACTFHLCGEDQCVLAFQMLTDLCSRLARHFAACSAFKPDNQNRICSQPCREGQLMRIAFLHSRKHRAIRKPCKNALCQPVQPPGQLIKLAGLWQKDRDHALMGFNHIWIAFNEGKSGAVGHLGSSIPRVAYIYPFGPAYASILPPPGKRLGGFPCPLNGLMLLQPARHGRRENGWTIRQVLAGAARDAFWLLRAGSGACLLG